MGPGKVVRELAFALCAAAVLVGCSDDDASDGSNDADGSASEQPAAPSTVTVVLGEDTISVEGTPVSGAVEVTVDGGEMTEVGFTRVADGTTVDEFISGIEEVLQGGAFSEFMLDSAGVISEATVMLDEGSYVVWAEIGGSEEGAGQVAGTELEITAGEGAELPETDGTFVATDYSFEVDAQGGDQYTFDNQSTEQFHHVILFNFGDLDPTVVEENLLEFISAEEGAPPPEAFAEVDFESLEAGGSGVFGPGSAGTFAATLEPGTTYAAICFIQDREGGPPHAMQHDMYDVFTLS